MDLRPKAADTLKILVLAVAYVAAARIGFLFDPVGGFASLVWAPSGIALVALVLHGARLWPGVFLGAAIANLLIGASLPLAATFGIGNTLGALAAALALHRLQFDASLQDTRSAIHLVAISAASAAIPASIGATALVASGGATPASLVWQAWWIGDTIGNLLVAPLVFVWSRRTDTLARSRRAEFVVALVATVAVAVLVFLPGGSESWRAGAYLLFPSLIWAAVRFGARGAVTAVTLAAMIAIFGTAKGGGPFANPELATSLLGLQTFMGVVAGTFLVLGATIAERRRAAQEALEAREQAEEANRAKAEFLGVMSHELRTPLNAINGFVDLLLMGAQGPITELQRSSLERVQRNQFHLLALINDLMAFTRLEAGKVNLDITTVPVRRIFDDVEPLILPDLRRKSLRFERASVEGSLAVRADADKACQVLLNLLSNAVKYTDVGGTVAIGASVDGDFVRIWVRDSGIGIPADQLDKVFDPFFQVDRGRTRKYPGVGLGLSIARDLAAAMGGDVSAESTVAVGTTMTVRLPRA